MKAQGEMYVKGFGKRSTNADVKSKRFCCFPNTKAWKASWQATVSPPSNEYQELIPREELDTGEAITTNNHNSGKNTRDMMKIVFLPQNACQFERGCVIVCAQHRGRRGNLYTPKHTRGGSRGL